MKKFFRIIFRSVKWVSLVILLSLVYLFFFDVSIPKSCVDSLLTRYTPPTLDVSVNSLSFGFGSGLCVRGLKITERDAKSPQVIEAESLWIDPLRRTVVAVGLRYPRLPESYYKPGNVERNARVEAVFPDVPRFSVTLIRPDILSVTPRRVEAEIDIEPFRLTADRIHLDWPDTDVAMSLKGFCFVDLNQQEIYGEVDGLAKQHHIRPMLVALDVPVSLPYFDGFTEVKEPVPSWCSWKVNLINNDFDLRLNLHPLLGKYNKVPLTKADGKIHLHVYTRGTNLNYRQTFGPITGLDGIGRGLDGTVLVSGTNGYNVVSVKAKSALPVAQLLKIGGFTGEYVGDDVFGNSSCDLEFRFPRSMTNNYEVLNGRGHLEIHDGQLMRMKGFAGLLELLADKVPGVSWFTDSTQGSCDYVIRDGVLSSENIYIEGTVFSIKMFGSFDTIRNKLDFTVRVQFTKKDSFMGKILHPLTWPFTKLLLEFKLTGTPDKPEWHYLTVVDRLVEVVQ